MSKVDATFQIPEKIAKGLADGMLERVGGVIRDVDSKQVLTWLREVYDTGEPVFSDILSLSSATAATGGLNLAVATMSFAAVMKRLNAIEQELKQAEELLRTIDYKIDLSFYANFRAALDLAANAFRMTKAEMRRTSALQAISRFLEAKHHYTSLVDKEIASGSRVADDYLSTLCLAYVTEVRCYLELDEISTAHDRLQDGLKVLGPRFRKHLNTLLTSNPAAYLHPSLKDQIDLKRLTRVYQWLTPGKNETAVFEDLRENMFTLAQNPKEWAKALPQAVQIPKIPGVFDPKNIMGVVRGLKGWVPKRLSTFIPGGEEAGKGLESEIYRGLPLTLQLMETMIEDYCRFEMYLAEIQTVDRLGMNFRKWQQLAPAPGAKGADAGLMYITVSA